MMPQVLPDMAEKKEYEFKWDGKEIKHRWEGFVKFGNASAVEMTGKNFDKWLKDAGVIDAKNITTTMTGIAFSKVTGPKKKATFNETKDVLAAVAEDRARTTKKDPQEELDAITEKLAKLEAPALKGVAKASADGVYNRLTDHTKYTGSHKERFDADGKGRGKLGREDIVEQTGKAFCTILSSTCFVFHNTKRRCERYTIKCGESKRIPDAPGRDVEQVLPKIPILPDQTRFQKKIPESPCSK